MQTRKKIRVRELDYWPPDPGGPGGNYKVPASGEAILSRVVTRKVEHLVFVATFEGREHSYDFDAPTEDVAKQLRQAFEKNIGKTVFDLGDLQIEVEK
jgi:hypothetical protein